MNILRQCMLILVVLMSGLLGYQTIHADERDDIRQNEKERLQLLSNTLGNYSVAFRRDIPLGSPIIIDLNQLKEIASESFPDVELDFIWSTGTDTQNGEIFNFVFDDFGEKNIKLEVTGILNESSGVVYEAIFEIFVFSETMIFAVEENQKELYRDFKNKARGNGILVNEFGFFNESQISDLDFGELFLNYRSRFSESSDFVVILGSKEFAITFLRQGSIIGKIGNIVILSSYNRTLFREYFSNSFSNEEIEWNAFLLSDIHIDQLLRESGNYKELRETLIENGYNILDFDFKIRGNPLFFISSQIQFLGKYFTQSELYILLLIPFFITAISIWKHILGINTLGIIIPVFLTYLMIYTGIIESLIFFIALGVINIILAQYLNRYALLYTPKITFLMLINICIFFLLGHIFESLGLPYIDFQSLIVFIFFIILSERFLVIATSKEFLEYKSAIIGTLVLCSFLALISSIDILRIILFSYPEIIILLLPLNFYIAQFTGLRVTEYLRFKELMKDIEE